MHFSEIKDKLHPLLYKEITKKFTDLTPSQEKAVKAGLFTEKNLLVCTPTASGKTLIGMMAGMNGILNKVGKCVYVVPLKALATEKYNDWKDAFPNVRAAVSIGDLDSADPYLAEYDLIFTTSEKMDSLIRHRAPWLKDVKTLVVDEVHLLNDASRGPTLEILITLLRTMLKDLHIIALSATIGNPKELASWLDANLVIDSWRPVELRKGIYQEGKIKFE